MDLGRGFLVDYRVVDSCGCDVPSHLRLLRYYRRRPTALKATKKMSGLSLIIDLLVAALAGCQVTETWHHGGIFRGVRAKLKSVQDDGSRSWPVRRLSELLTCPFCSSHWVCFACVLVMWLADWDSFWRLPVYGFAVTRIAQLVSDATHGIVRSPESAETEEVDQTAEVDRFEVVDEEEVSLNP